MHLFERLFDILYYFCQRNKLQIKTYDFESNAKTQIFFQHKVFYNFTQPNLRLYNYHEKALD